MRGERRFEVGEQIAGVTLCKRVGDAEQPTDLVTDAEPLIRPWFTTAATVFLRRLSAQPLRATNELIRGDRHFAQDRSQQPRIDVPSAMHWNWGPAAIGVLHDHMASTLARDVEA